MKTIFRLEMTFFKKEYPIRLWTNYCRTALCQGHVLNSLDEMYKVLIS